MQNLNDSDLENDSVDTSETDKVAEDAKFRASVKASPFEVKEVTVDLIRDTVFKHYQETNGGMSAPDLAALTMGDGKFSQGVIFVAIKYLDDVLEIRKGVGICPKGAECSKSRSVRKLSLSEDYISRVEAHCLTCLEKAKKAGGKIQMSVKAIKAAALKADVLAEREEDRLWGVNSKGEDTDADLQAAISVLSESPKYEIKAGDFMFRKPIFNPMSETNEIPVPPNRKTSESNGHAAG